MFQIYNTFSKKKGKNEKNELTGVSFFEQLFSKKKPLRGNGAASNDCLPYEKKFKSC